MAELPQCLDHSPEVTQQPIVTAVHKPGQQRVHHTPLLPEVQFGSPTPGLDELGVRKSIEIVERREQQLSLAHLDLLAL